MSPNEITQVLSIGPIISSTNQPTNKIFQIIDLRNREQQIWKNDRLHLNSFYFTCTLAFVFKEKWMVIMIAPNEH